MKYFDTHAHYYDERFSEELNGSVDELIDALCSETLSCVVNIGTSPETSRLAIEQAKRHEKMYTAVGIHPSDTRFLSDMKAELCEIEKMLLDPASRAVAIGEIGLDYHYPDTDRERQMRYFTAQMEMAERLGMPVVIHDREAHGDIMEVIRKFPRVSGILHSFSGSAEMARELVALGYYISFSGTLTFTNAKKPREVASQIPRDRILIETDCPYLAPHPRRGTLNHSGNLVYTNAALAGVLGISEEECAALTSENGRRAFGL
ncbi:MAG: TatD family hydrolase [Clostridia bacterium]|nr:TatD family hydrolase [Clostridia bacterium]